MDHPAVMVLQGLLVSVLLGGWLMPGLPALAGPPPGAFLPPRGLSRQWVNASDQARRLLYKLECPEGWWVDRDPDKLPGMSVLNGEAICGVHPVDLPPRQSLQSFYPFMSAFHAAELFKMGLAKEVVSRRPIQLPNGLPAMEQEVVIHQGGMSLELYVVQGDVGYFVICETEARLWPSYRQIFERILRSFVVDRQSP